MVLSLAVHLSVLAYFFNFHNASISMPQGSQGLDSSMNAYTISSEALNGEQENSLDSEIELNPNTQQSDVEEVSKTHQSELKDVKSDIDKSELNSHVVQQPLVEQIAKKQIIKEQVMPQSEPPSQQVTKSTEESKTKDAPTEKTQLIENPKLKDEALSATTDDSNPAQDLITKKSESLKKQGETSHGKEQTSQLSKKGDNATSAGVGDDEISPIYAPSPRYPAQARRLGYEGQVELMVEISEQGQVMDATIINSSGHSVLDKAAIRAIKKWRFDTMSANTSSKQTVIFKLK